MVLIDRDHLLPALREQCKAEQKERAFLLEGAYHSGAFFLESFVDLQSYVQSSTEAQLDLDPHFVLAALRSAQKAIRLFVFLHTHPSQGNLHFSQLDRCFELNVIKLARQAGYLEPLIFLVASSQDTIGRAYRNGQEEALRITDDEWSIPRGWLARIQVLTDEAMPYGVLYDPKSNGVVRLAASAARLIADKQRQQRARSLPAEEWEALESKLREAFHNDQRTFLQRTPTYLDTGELYQLEILLQNSCNLRCRYCFAEGGTYGQQTVRLTPEQGRRIIRILVQQGIHKISKIAFFGGEPSTLPDTMEAICDECARLVACGQMQESPEFFIITNCISISQKCMKVLHRYRIHVTISIDGPAEINDQLRVFPNGYKTHDLVLRNLQKLRAHGIEPAMVEATYTAIHERAGLSREETVAALQEELGISGIYLCDCDCSDPTFEPTYEGAAARIAQDNRSLALLFLEKKYEEVPLMLRQFVIQTSRRLNMKEGQDYLCEAGLQSLTIAANGDIYPCHMFIPGKYMLLDNIFLGDFDLQASKPAVDELEMYTKLGRETCRDCWARNICNMCLYRIYQTQWRADARDKLADHCKILKNQLEKTILYLSNMQQAERKALYDAIGKLQPVKHDETQ